MTTQLILIICIIIGFCIYDLYGQIATLKRKIFELSPLGAKNELEINNPILEDSPHEDHQIEATGITNDNPIIPIVNTAIEKEIAPQTPTYLDTFVDRFRQDWPMKVGGLVFILWVGRFLSYAIQNNRISPAMRVALGVITSIAMIGFGRYTMPKQTLQWSYLVWLWSAVYVLSIYIWFKFFGFFGVPLGLGLIALQYFVMAFLSHKSNNHWINDVSLFFSMISPFLFSDGSWNIIWLFWYLSIHLLGNIFVSYSHNRSASRLMGVLYLGIYGVLSLLDPSIWNPIVLSMLIGLVTILSVFEVVIIRVKNNGYSIVQLISLSLLWVWLFWYITSLSLTNHIDSALYSSILLCYFVGYGLLWYIFSISNKQNSYSGIVWILSVLFLAWLSYYHLSGVWLLLASIIIAWAVQSLVAITTKDKAIVRYTSISRIIPFFLLAYNYDFGDLSNYYLTSIYTWAVLMWWLAFLFSRFTYEKYLINTFIVVGIWLLYFWLCNSFDELTRIVALESVSVLWILIWFIIHCKKEEFLFWSMISIILPSLYLFYEWISKDFNLFSLLRIIIWIVFVWVYLANKLESINKAEEISLQNILSSIWLWFIYLSVLYIIPNQYYTLSYTVLSMLIYLCGTRLLDFYGTSKLKYSWFMIVPILSSLMLLRWWDAFMLILTNLLLTISLFWLKFDNEDEESDAIMWYIFYGFSLLYFWIFWFVSAREFSDSASAIVIMLIVFTIIWIIFYIHGKKQNSTQYRNIWAAIILWVIGRVLVVELRQMSLIMRIITCLIIGGLLVASGFIGNKKKDIPLE